MKRKVGLETQKYKKKKFDLLKSRKVLKVEMNSPPNYNDLHFHPAYFCVPSAKFDTFCHR